MTKDECRSIFKEAWHKAIQKEFYPKYIMGAHVGGIYFLRDICMQLFPENNIADQLNYEQYEKVSATQIRATTNDFGKLGLLTTQFEKQELTNVNKGDVVFIKLENSTLLKKLAGKITSYLYMGNNLLFDINLGHIIDWLEWKQNGEWSPRLLFSVRNSGNNSISIDGKQFRPNGEADKLIWDEFWSKV
jgi:hypothetical protein